MLIAAPAATAAPVDPNSRVTLDQPSGPDVTARPVGDEWYRGYETPDGYTLVRNARTGTWEYARKRPRGTLAPTGVRAGRRPPAGISPHLRDERKLAARETALRAPHRSEPPRSPLPRNVGAAPTLVILVQFSDQPALGTTPEHWHSQFFGATASVADYFSEASHGAFTIAPAAESHGTANDGVVGWVTLSRAHPRVNSLGNADDLARAEATMAEAVQAANPYVDYAQYDDDGNGQISSDELHLAIVPAGWEAVKECGSPAFHGHQGWIPPGSGSVDGVTVGNIDAGGGYSVFGEMHCDGDPSAGHPATLGILAHEFGHDLDMPDLYDGDGPTFGVGAWSLMGYGIWLSLPGRPAGADPSLLDAWSKYYQGWIAPQQVRGTAQRTIPQAATSGTALQVLANPGGVDWRFYAATPGTGEYFLVENRQQVGYDVALPGCGIVIWHIDETRDTSNLANATDTRRLVDVEEADGGDYPFAAADAWTAGGPPTFDHVSVPNSRLYNGVRSGVRVSNFSPCATNMSATISDDDVFSQPSAVTGAATRVGSDTATLHGTLDTGGVDAQYRFEYGLSTAYGQSSSLRRIGRGNPAVPVSANLTGLKRRRTYHYRLVAVRGDRVLARGADRTFLTGPRTPGVRALRSSGQRGRNVRLRYRVADDGGFTAQRIGIFRGKRRVKLIRTPMRAARWTVARHVTWRAPRGRGRYRFCVRAVDLAGNSSRRSCARIVLRRPVRGGLRSTQVTTG